MGQRLFLYVTFADFLLYLCMYSYVFAGWFAVLSHAVVWGFAAFVSLGALAGHIELSPLLPFFPRRFDV